MKYLAFCVIWVYSANIYAVEQQIDSLFKAHNAIGSMLIESTDGTLKYQYNIDSNASFVPASTFKIPNTLIILEEGLIKDTSEVITWDGIVREYAPWNKDQTLKTAFQFSCVWCYQRYAKKLGTVKYLEYLKAFGYGNQLTGRDVTRFWLDGDLRVSVQDQIRFLRKLDAQNLPIEKRYISTLKQLMLSKSDDKIKIWSKTGWSGKDGWYVGYLVSNKQTWFFAHHMVIKQRSDLALRKQLMMDVLKLLKII
ncbi:class D beta-lactamase [Pseudoalteromonas sp. MMG013]|uniref:class D beta-lactamase n=1 Tax=Pseudoalteromonas sp. MMG013 TaxID=2822687 RepID=UPI001B37E957|nr:class D beta-lactamase [Pseudoalteromonas sp. MMG013]MBQ4863044.1 class D beta-lactamase [Pseudoalteromonas sp. MMG013]